MSRNLAGGIGGRLRLGSHTLGSIPPGGADNRSPTTHRRGWRERAQSSAAVRSASFCSWIVARVLRHGRFRRYSPNPNRADRVLARKLNSTQEATIRMSHKSSHAVKETEEELIAKAQSAVSQSNWVVGECADKWTQRYARGRGDGDFAVLLGLTPDQVFQRRRVWQTFADVHQNYPALKWSHFYAALTWDDAPECLQWADETQSTVAEMKAWRRALRGEDSANRIAGSRRMGNTRGNRLRSRRSRRGQGSERFYRRRSERSSRPLVAW